MRLIDADELMEKIYSVKYLRKIKSKQLIDECKRIDAIPIKWIEKVYCLKLGGLPLSISHMIDDWRKENEHERSNNT